MRQYHYSRDRGLRRVDPAISHGGLGAELSDDASFPYGTLSVNVLGCLAIGLLGGWADNAELFSPSMRLFLLIGLLGGFTTFSTFGYEAMAMLRDKELLRRFCTWAGM